MSGYPKVGIHIKGVVVGISRRRIKPRAVAGAVLATAAMSLLVAPVGANASGGYTLSCQGASPVPVVPNSSVTCLRPGKPSDDDGPYVFSYSPPLTCGASGTFSVTAAGGEMQIGPANGSYVTVGTSISLTFSYIALETGVPPAVETHNVALTIDCLTGATTGTLSE
jgi:hypothetical protein